MATGISLQRGSGTSQKKCGYRLWPPNAAARLPGNEERQLGRIQRTTQEKSHRCGPWKEYAKLTRKWQRMKLDVWALCWRFGKRARTFCGGSLRQSALQQFCFGGLHLVGIDVTRRRQQQKEEALAVGGARLVEANTKGERPTGYWCCSSVSMRMKRRCSKRTQRLGSFVKT